MREDYFGPVGFAREPAEERKRWIARLILAIFLVFIGWLFWNRVVNTQGTNTITPRPTQSSLPGPL